MLTADESYGYDKLFTNRGLPLNLLKAARIGEQIRLKSGNLPCVMGYGPERQDLASSLAKIGNRTSRFLISKSMAPVNAITDKADQVLIWEMSKTTVERSSAQRTGRNP